MSLKCIIIDDEQYAVDALVKYIEEIPNLSIYATFTNPIEALSVIKAGDQVDFIFLDIEMPGINGLELAKSLRDKARFLIFTTSHTAHAIAAFDLKASHYLLKPITFSKFALTIADILKDTPTHKLVKPLLKNTPQFIRTDQKNVYHSIDSEKITFIQAAKNYVIIHTNDTEQHIIHLGLNHIETAIGTTDFIRINRSYIIAKKAIKKVEGNVVSLKNGNSIQLGGVYKAAFNAFINDSLLKSKL
jgi:two-component system LytT family response regulator